MRGGKRLQALQSNLAQTQRARIVEQALHPQPSGAHAASARLHVHALDLAHLDGQPL